MGGASNVLPNYSLASLTQNDANYHYIITIITIALVSFPYSCPEVDANLFSDGMCHPAQVDPCQQLLLVGEAAV